MNRGDPMWAVWLLVYLGAAVSGCSDGPRDCDPSTDVCATSAPECMTDAECRTRAELPICDARAGRCRGCRKHSECPGSSLCRYEAALPGPVAVGQCFPVDAVAIVDAGACPGTGPGAGTPAAPYCEVQDALDAGRSLIVVHPQEHSAPYKPIQLFAGQALLVGPSRDAEPQAVLSGVLVSGAGTRLELRDLALRSGAAEQALLCKGAEAELTRAVVEYSQDGLVAADGCRLRVARSKIEHCARAALRVSVGSGYRVVNSLFIDNGVGFTAQDRADLTDNVLDLSSALTDNRFTFNTLLGNRGFIYCRAGQTLRNSIVAGSSGGGPMPSPLRNDNCQLSHVFVGDEMGAALGSTYALSRDSRCCVDQAEPDLTVTTDYDGTPRPQGAGYDIGCYELR